MRTRLLGGCLFAVAVVGSLLAGSTAWSAAVALGAMLATSEVMGIASAAGRRPSSWIALPLAAALVVGSIAPRLPVLSAGPALPAAFWWQLAITLAVVAAFAAQLARDEADRSMEDLAVTLAAPLYIGALMSHLAALRLLPSGLAWAALLVALVWANDSFAYVGGKLWGRRPLAPRLSPHKTIEGVVAGTVATVAVSIGALAVGRVAAAAAAPSLGPAIAYRAFCVDHPLAIVALGCVVSIAAPLGDLSKSLLKRQAGLKDAGHLIPGHGGLLDRIDGLLFAAPAVFYLALAAGAA